MKKIIYYTVSNGGDGSAYPHFYDNEEVCEFDQEHMKEGWGEPCTGSLTITGENIEVDGLGTTETYLVDLLTACGEDEKAIFDEFVSQFYPNGFPILKISRIEQTPYGLILDIYGKCWGKIMIFNHTDIVYD